MLFEVHWHLSDLIDGPEYGWDVVDWEHTPTKDELNEFITNHIDGSPIYDNLVREKIPNFFGQHVQATRPSTWRITTIRPFKFKKGDIVMTICDETQLRTEGVMETGARLRVKSVRGDRIRVHHISGYLSLLGDDYGTFTYRPKDLKFIERKPSKKEKRRKRKNE